MYTVTHVFVTCVLQVSFKDYYKKQYGIDIQDIGQPLLVNRSKIKIRGQNVCMNLTHVSCLMGYQGTSKKNHLKRERSYKGNVKLRSIL